MAARLAILVDLGSTYTKAAAVDLDACVLVGWAKSSSTAETDVTDGLRSALAELRRLAGFSYERAELRLASSSAAGGLRLVAMGLVPELTSEAARRAALGAGAKVVRVFSYDLTRAEVSELEAIHPDIILLVGGTDGGNRSTIIHNASMVSRARTEAPVVVAGNKVVAEEVALTLREAGKETWITPNVLPFVDQLQVAPAQEAIREVFIRRIVRAKGFERARQFVQEVLMPTPTAVLRAAELLATGVGPHDGRANGLGPLLVVDVGGATTDVHSIGKGDPAVTGLIPKGLPEPYAKRTVEGDLGVRWNVDTIAREAGLPSIAARQEALLEHLQASEALPEGELAAAVARLKVDTSYVATDAWGISLDGALAACAVDIAVSRHAGQVEYMFTPSGRVSVLYGKDLTEFGTVVGTGGPLVSNPYRRQILETAIWDPRQPQILKPRSPKLLVDSKYIMFAVGLLAERDANAAWRLAESSLIEV